MVARQCAPVFLLAAAATALHLGNAARRLRHGSGGKKSRGISHMPSRQQQQQICPAMQQQRNPRENTRRFARAREERITGTTRRRFVGERPSRARARLDDGDGERPRLACIFWVWYDVRKSARHRRARAHSHTSVVLKESLPRPNGF